MSGVEDKESGDKPLVPRPDDKVACEGCGADTLYARLIRCEGKLLCPDCWRECRANMMRPKGR